jgi:hypothetical protein
VEISKVILKLKRFSYCKDRTLGLLLDNDGIPICCTLEDPWLENRRNESCIPVGLYQVIPFHSKKFAESYILQNVINRGGILIHPGNTPLDTQGCILVGELFDKLGNLVNSQKAFENFKRLVKNNVFLLEIER